jgi:pyruvate dehydrogenase E1 component
MKKMTEAPLRTFRDRLELPIRDDQLAEELPPYAHPGVDSPEYEYLMERRRALGGHLPERVVRPRRVALPGEDAYRELLVGTGDNVSASTTGAFSRLLRNLMRDPDIGPRVVPIIPDEARTFGIDGLFRQFKIYAPGGQCYEPVDAGLLLSYQEAPDGQILEEGINEAGAMASFTAAATAYATGASQPSRFSSTTRCSASTASGICCGRPATCGPAASCWRSPLGAPRCKERVSSTATATVCSSRPLYPTWAYDPAFAYEVAVIIRDRIGRMSGADPRSSCITSPFTTRPTRSRRCPLRCRTGSWLASTATSQPSATEPIGPKSWPAAPPCSPPSMPSDASSTTTTWPPKCGARRATRPWATKHSPPSAGTASTLTSPRGSLTRNRSSRSARAPW